ncbi:pentatricopeptide repeat-containing protein At1g06140, mitochondrial [Selaginella moellendorffii]|nr:pentatricopeptide repeat-containing protein At1g06140, mitochondrial [Selaginella moellendorffii]|eukprot:XP_002960931.2 pentatricopeptide repeat-containing protein At1g06140, mitochondrial [Selaginella moellendorffii]
MARISGVLDEMERAKSQAAPSTYAAVLRRCADDRALEQGQRIHDHIRKFHGLSQDRFLANCLADMYGKCGRPDESRKIFDAIADKNVFSWTILIAAFSESADRRWEALHLLRFMDQSGVAPNAATFVSVLVACSELRCLDAVIALHARIASLGLDLEIVVGTALVNAYGKCGSVDRARNAFAKMPRKNSICWTAVITANAQNGRFGPAMELYERMVLEGLKPDRVTFVSALDACASSPRSPPPRYRAVAAQRIASLAAAVAASGHGSSPIVAAALLNMYGKLGELDRAREIFHSLPERNAVMWNVMIAVSSQAGAIHEALGFFWAMNLDGAARPDGSTFTSIISACAAGGVPPDLAVRIHGALLSSGVTLDDQLLTALLGLYAKCSRTDDARRVFSEIWEKGVVPWTALISALAADGRSSDAVAALRRMELEGVRPNEYTFVAAIEAASQLGIAHGRSLHARATSAGLDSDPFVANTVMAMYASCGSIAEARAVFDGMGHRRNLVSWNCMIEALARHGHSLESLELYSEMELDGVPPSAATFVSVLAACSHVGEVELGYHYFVAFRRDYGIQAEAEHIGCVVDLLGRAGWLDSAESFIQSLPAADLSSSWAVLLGACKTHGDATRGARVAGWALGVDGQDAASYVTVSNLLRR